MQLPDYYQTLGVARGETPENIKNAYRKLARRYHPDISKEKDAERRMKEINEAYQVISDPKKRAEYDALRDASTRSPRAGFGDASPGAQSRGGFGDFRGFENDLDDFHFFQSGGDRPGFEGFGGLGDMFDQVFGRSDAMRDAPPFRATQDDATRAAIELDIEDAFTGAQREISVRLPYCDAAGRSRSRQRRLKVNIPAGACEGKVIRLAGQGAPGLDGEASDLLLEVRFRPHPKMRAVKRDVYMELPLAPWEAALGAVMPVAIPTGSVKVRIPKGVQEGSQLRVPGRGIPGRPPGDLILQAKIVLPPADSSRAAQAYEAFAREAAFDPRG